MYLTTALPAAFVLGCLLLNPPARGDDVSGPKHPALRLQRIDAGGKMASFASGSAETVKLPPNQAHGRDRGTTFQAVGLPRDIISKLRGETIDQALAAELLKVFVVSADRASSAASQPLLGTYRLRDDVLGFQPRFPLEPGVIYEARLVLPAGDGGGKAGHATTARFEVPDRPRESTTRVEQVYPTSDVLPENQLKFYLHFSAPMSTGQAYRHVRLLDAAGKPIEGAFLEIGEELWDRSGQRFTLFFDPGRIKRGLRPREELGPALEEGKSYTLVVGRGWQDAKGNVLVADFRKSFRVVEPDDTPPDEANWRIERPTKKNGFVLSVDFPEPLDHALLERVMWVERGADPRQAERVAGDIEVSRQETHWQFTPAEPLADDARYFLVVERIIEDRAGNHLGRKFEVDVFDKIDRRTTAEQVRIPISGPSVK